MNPFENIKLHWRKVITKLENEILCFKLVVIDPTNLEYCSQLWKQIGDIPTGFNEEKVSLRYLAELETGHHNYWNGRFKQTRDRQEGTTLFKKPDVVARVHTLPVLIVGGDIIRWGLEKWYITIKRGGGVIITGWGLESHRQYVKWRGSNKMGRMEEENLPFFQLNLQFTSIYYCYNEKRNIPHSFYCISTYT